MEPVVALFVAVEKWRRAIAATGDILGETGPKGNRLRDSGKSVVRGDTSEGCIVSGKRAVDDILPSEGLYLLR